MKTESVQRGRNRYYPCNRCEQGQHPSVTTLLNVISSPALNSWLQKNGTAKLNVLTGIILRDAPDTFKTKWALEAEQQWKLTEKTQFWKSGKLIGEEAADVGTMAHAWIEADLHKTPLDMPPTGPLRNVIEGYLHWSTENKVEVIETERTFYNCAINYAGTADAVLMINGELTLMDWKTSMGIFNTYPIQTWSYALAHEMSDGELLYRQVGIGRFGKDGSSEIRIFKRNDWPGIEVARDVIQACGAIFDFVQKWERMFPYVKPKPKEKSNDGTQAAP